jgi:hypothetical protein
MKLKLYILSILSIIFISGCYSFTGGSLPEHLHTIKIENIEDNSSYGKPLYRENLHQYITDEFNRDGSLKLVNNNGDCQLTVTITSINENSTSMSNQDLETERKLTINVSVDFFDNTTKKSILKKNFSNYANFDINNIEANREEAADKILKILAEDILFGVVSGW